MQPSITRIAETTGTTAIKTVQPLCRLISNHWNRTEIQSVNSITNKPNTSRLSVGWNHRRVRCSEIMPIA
jgi:hypothetical protein